MFCKICGNKTKGDIYCEKCRELQVNSNQSNKRLKSKWELNKKLFQGASQIHLVFLFFIPLGMFMISLLMMSLPSSLVKDISYSKYYNPFLEIVEKVSLFQSVISIFVVFIYSFIKIFKETNIITTKVKLYNDKLIITNEKYVEYHSRRLRPLGMEFISKPWSIT